MLARIGLVALLLSLLLVACSKSDKDAAPGSAVAPAAPTAPPQPKTPWAYDAAAIQAKLQGAWVVKDDGYLGAISAWEVSGNHVKAWDARNNTETLETMTIEGPCQLTLDHPAKGGGTEGTTSHFVFDGDTLHMGLGDAGVKQGGAIVGCISNGIYVADAASGACKFYLADFRGGWEAKDATCKLDGATFTAANKTFDSHDELTVHGDVLAGDQLWRGVPERAASYDAAKVKAKELAGAAR